MPVQICSTCGTSYPDAAEPPSHCSVCEDERQFVSSGGQAWTTREKLARGHVNTWRQLETGLFEIHTYPQFGIGQRALLLQTDHGNVLWDCIALLDDTTEALIRGLGGLRAIAISHPHYYTCMQDWARRFDCPVHLHAADGMDHASRSRPSSLAWRDAGYRARRDADQARWPLSGRHRASLG
jgi:hypothetical protein